MWILASTASCADSRECESGTVRWKNGRSDVCVSGRGSGVVANPFAKAKWKKGPAVSHAEGSYIFDRDCVGELEDTSFCTTRDTAIRCDAKKSCEGPTCVTRVKRRQSKCASPDVCQMNGDAATCGPSLYELHAYFLMSGGKTVVRGGATLDKPQLVEKMYNLYVESDSWWIALVNGEMSLKRGSRLFLEGSPRHPRPEFHALLTHTTRQLSDAVLERAVKDIELQIPPDGSVELPVNFKERLRGALEAAMAHPRND